MPIVESPYRPAIPFKNGHLSTIYSAKIRRVSNPYLKRLRLNLADDDFLDLDLSFHQSDDEKICLLLHGLEGNSQRSYMKGSTAALKAAGWHVVAINYRGCSGSPNKHFRSYNAGITADLEFVINYLNKNFKPRRMALVGFSLGGNLLMKYLSTRTAGWDKVDKAVAISAPLDLKGTLLALNSRDNWLYRTAFLLSLKSKLKEKAKRFPKQFDPKQVSEIKSLLDFDNVYTAPAHGYKDAFDYYAKSSCGQYLPELQTPILLLNAHNDSFLCEASYPFQLAKNSEYLFFEAPDYGGHVGFVDKNNLYYSEQKIIAFLDD